jgi:hypothetical protein
VDSVLEIVESVSTVVQVDDDVLEVVIVDDQADVIVVDDIPAVVVEQDRIEVVDVGTQGPQGPPGADGGSYYHSQVGVSDTWVVLHNLGYRPNVTSFNSADSQVEGEVVHDSVNQLTVTFSSAFSGYAVVS